MRLPRPRTLRQRIVAGLVALAVVGGLVTVVALASGGPAVRTQVQLLPGTPEPGGAPVQLDTTLYLPQHTPAPAILLAHGFGGSKADLDGQARSLARSGYVVLAYTARGFGASGGLIHLDSPTYEVADARRLVDYLATRPEVQLDAPGDPRIGVAGSSYGGALALLLAGYDRRIDAVAADITWNNLATSLFPNGVFKKLWAGYLFGAAAPTGGTGSCGRFAPVLCRAYQQLAQGRSTDLSVLSLLNASSPSTILSRITAPTLLTQGEQDSLFPLGQAEANAKGIAAHGTPVSVLWRAGGHDTGAGADVGAAAAKTWFGEVLHGHRPTTRSDVTLQGAALSAQSGEQVNQTLRVPSGLTGTSATRTVTVSGAAQTIDAPAGGTPAAISSLPGLSSVLSLAGSVGALGSLSAIPGQVASFTSAPLSAQELIVGASSVTLSVTALDSTGATLFLALQDVAPDGTQTLPGQLVTPIELTGLTKGRAEQVTVALPAVVARIGTGHRLRLTVGTTDQGYLLPTDPRSYRISLAGDAAPVTVPTPATASIGGGSPVGWLVAGGLVALLALLAGFVLVRRSTRSIPAAAVDGVEESAPVVVTDLVKEYSDGFRAVGGVSFRVERGQIVGLLGPNGAGKTTTLRVLMGLIRPTSGTVSLFGQEVRPGARVLSRVGAFVEGPGLLPHLSGRANLRLYWAASGRPAAAAQVETALEIAGLGSSIDRRVKTYSHGMRQRLAIAQAMLGLPELLVLDEPTNGLDPPQIAEMRQVLRSYAATGRTVVVSSHLLAEVEQTCSHVVVMHRGRLIVAGTVDEVAGTDGVTLAVEDPRAAREVLALAGMTATEVPARRALEDVFLELVGDADD